MNKLTKSHVVQKCVEGKIDQIITQISSGQIVDGDSVAEIVTFFSCIIQYADFLEVLLTCKLVSSSSVVLKSYT